MPTHVGPNISGEENLVFGYDLSDQKNSYLGEPTTNLANNTPLLGGWPGSYTLIDSATKTFDFTTSSVEWGGVASWTTFYYNVSEYTGQYVTISAVVESFDETSGVFNFMWIGQTINEETYLGYSPEQDRNTKTTKTRERISWSGVIGTGGKVGILIWMNNGSGGSSGSVKVRFSNIQVEVKSHPTPFVNGTRSATQGLIDVTGNSTINLSDVSFNSNASMLFDGTNDKIQTVQTTHSYLNSSAIEFVVTPNVINKRMTVGGYRHNEGYSQPTIGMVYIGDDNVFRSSVITAAEVYRSVASTTTIVANQTYHVVLNKNTATGVLEIFVNGSSQNSTTFSVSTYGQWTTAGSYIGSDYLDFGKSFNTNSGQGWSSDYLNGTIHLFKLYSRTLNSTEVLNNYNNIKRKYGI